MASAPATTTVVAPARVTSSIGASSIGASIAVESVTPVFLKDREIGNGFVTPIQVYKAITEVIGSSQIGRRPKGEQAVESVCEG